MKPTKPILFLLLFVFISACNSTIPTPTISPTVVPDTQTSTPVFANIVVPAPPEATATPTENPKPETFAPMELSINPNKPGKCTYEDVTSGRWAWNVKQQARPPSKDDVNLGWVKTEGGSTSDITPKIGSVLTDQDPFICQMTGDFEGLPNKKLYVIGIPAINKDGTTGVLNILTDNNVRYNLKHLLSVIKDTKGSGLVIVRQRTDSTVKSEWNDPIYAFLGRLYRTEGEDKISYAVNELETIGIISTNTEKLLLTAYTN